MVPFGSLVFYGGYKGSGMKRLNIRVKSVDSSVQHQIVNHHLYIFCSKTYVLKAFLYKSICTDPTNRHTNQQTNKPPKAKT